ncbi:unnamed protein product [Closterium sp. NIES-65]|nr:unnamed protein product [Closterium sp. NIES-65]
MLAPRGTPIVHQSLRLECIPPSIKSKPRRLPPLAHPPMASLARKLAVLPAARLTARPRCSSSHLPVPRSRHPLAPRGVAPLPASLRCRAASPLISSCPSVAALSAVPWFSAAAGRRSVASSASAGGGGRGAREAEEEWDREVLVQHLVVGADQLPLLLELQRRIMADESDLSDLAAEHSLCASRAKGGMVGWISKGSTEPEFEEAAFKARPGDVVRCKTKHGWHLLQVLGDRHAALLDQVTVEEFARRLSEEYVLPPPQGGAAGRGGADSKGRSLEAELAEVQAESEGRRAVQLVDVREEREVEMAAIRGFTVLPLSQFGQWGPSIADTLDPHTDTYLLCHHGIRSQQMAHWLQSQGFTRLFNIAGGIDAYSLRVDPSIPRY